MVNLLFVNVGLLVKSSVVSDLVQLSETVHHLKCCKCTLCYSEIVSYVYKLGL